MSELQAGYRRAAADGFLSVFMRRYGVWLAAALILIAAPHIPGLTSGFARSVLSQMGMWIIFALSYNMLLGQGAMLSFGHAAFFGLGGFIVVHALNAIKAKTFWFPLELTPLLGGLMGLFFGAIFGYISTRRAGTTFAMISLGIGEMVYASSLMFTGFFGGEAGVSGNRVTGITILPFRYGPDIQVYYLIVAWLLLSALAMLTLTKTPLGRMVNAVRDNPERAQFVGYDPHIVRFIQHSLSGFFAGIAGGLFAITYEIVTAEAVGAHFSGLVLLMTFIGGIRQFYGPAIGAILVTILSTVVALWTKAWLMYFGLIFVLMVLYAPFGISGIIAAHQPVWRAGQLGRLIGPYLSAVVPAILIMAGVVVLVEINYFLSIGEGQGAAFKVFGIAGNPRSLLAWGAGLALILVGGVLLRFALPGVERAWAGVTEELKARGLA
jgi:branched-chain amino acid transport system permease protein